MISKALSAEDDSWLVTETSSFQLETIRDFKPEVSAILNLTPDHLDRHKTMENYGKAKAAVFRNQTPDQYCVINYDDEECMKLVRDCKAKIVPFSRKKTLDFGVYVDGDTIIIKDEDGSIKEICRPVELQIPGAHNLENALAACAIAYFGGIEPSVIADVLRSFKGVEHRIELCGVIDDIRFVNDSKGTNPDAAIKGIQAMDRPTLLIGGGYDKKSTYDEWIEAFGDKVKYLVLIGQTREKIAEQQKRLRALEAQLTEEENLEIVRMVKAVKMDNRELTAFLKAYASGLITLPEGMMEAEAAADPGENDMEDTKYEE